MYSDVVVIFLIVPGNVHALSKTFISLSRCVSNPFKELTIHLFGAMMGIKAAALFSLFVETFAQKLHVKFFVLSNV